MLFLFEIRAWLILKICTVKFIFNIPKSESLLNLGWNMSFESNLVTVDCLRMSLSYQLQLNYT